MPEDTILEALELAHTEIRKICAALDGLREQVGKAKWVDVDLTAELEAAHGEAVRAAIAEHGVKEAGTVVEQLVESLSPAVSMTSTEDDMTKRAQIRASFAAILEKARLVGRRRPAPRAVPRGHPGAHGRRAGLEGAQVGEARAPPEPDPRGAELPFPVGPEPAEGEPAVKDSQTKQYVKRAFDAVYKDLVRKKIAVDKRRPDGRSEEEIRPVSAEVQVSPRTHGSALFTRGQTQIMTLLTLGTMKEGQRIDDLSLEQNRRYMHHYNFPPFSVGETGFMRGPKRRDIGHGALAQRALEAVIPPVEDFPYTLRLVSETLESNGSSSMGSVCGSTLALMDAGVPDHRARLRDRDGPRQGGRRLRHPHRHPGRRGSPR